MNIKIITIFSWLQVTLKFCYFFFYIGLLSMADIVNIESLGLSQGCLKTVSGQSTGLLCHLTGLVRQPWKHAWPTYMENSLDVPALLSLSKLQPVGMGIPASLFFSKTTDTIDRVCSLHSGRRSSQDWALATHLVQLIIFTFLSLLFPTFTRSLIRLPGITS